MFVACDFHNHSCLSPCGSLEQSPALLARLARKRGLGLVALTDHNSALNAPAFAECAAGGCVTGVALVMVVSYCGGPRGG